MTLISQLVKSISRGFQKLLKYFNDNAILISFVLSSGGVYFVIFILNMNDLEFVITVDGLYL